ncbi:Signal transduction histidine kinase [Catenovulum agarivorans DS-2]|uniref:Signal transduction histidine kinase n=1 Tax=Catenovulum agarivorans DS-2 TaxID=1328313 RepID=W7QUY0_9ALTE|nr:ATP-binding protein [Catenovulum agarivorans]EWH09090.1 Signal transduction histidine kinase [Catenovulum agarivorans DS-2]
MLNKIKIPVWIVITVLLICSTLTTYVAQQAIKHYSFSAWLDGRIKPAATPFAQQAQQHLSAPFHLFDAFSTLVVSVPNVSPEQLDFWVKQQITNTPEIMVASLAAYSTNNARLQHIYSAGTAEKYQQDSYQQTLLSMLHKSQQQQGVVSKRLDNTTLLLGKKVHLANAEWFFLSEIDLNLLKLPLIKAHPQTKLNFALQAFDKQKMQLINWHFGKLHTDKNQIQITLESSYFDITLSAEPTATFLPKWQAPEVSKLIGITILATLLLTLLLLLIWYQQRQQKVTSQLLQEQNHTIHQQLTSAKESIKRNSRFAIINDMAPIAAAEISPAVSQAIKAVSSLEERTINLKNKLTDGRVTKSLVGSYLDNATKLTRASSSQLLIAAEATYTLEQFASDLKQDTLRNINLQLHTAAITSIYKKSNQHKKVKFIENLPGDLEISAYSGSLTHAICVVLNNSIEHGFSGKPDGIVMIEAFKSKDKQSIQMRIEDNGNGIDDDTLNKIFATESIDTHSGLHLAQQIISDKLNGKIEVSSKLGRFTRVNLTLPITENKN